MTRFSLPSLCGTNQKAADSGWHVDCQESFQVLMGSDVDQCWLMTTIVARKLPVTLPVIGHVHRRCRRRSYSLTCTSDRLGQIRGSPMLRFWPGFWLRILPRHAAAIPALPDIQRECSTRLKATSVNFECDMGRQICKTAVVRWCRKSQWLSDCSRPYGTGCRRRAFRVQHRDHHAGF